MNRGSAMMFVPSPVGGRELSIHEDDGISEADLERVLRIAPRGAFVLTGIAVAILLLAWLGVYFFVFLPRGPIS